MTRKFLGKEPSKIDFRSGIGTAEEFATSGRWVLVKSSNAKRIMYDRGMQRLLVEFRNNSIYEYLQVPKRVAKEMFNASSVGRFVWRRLRDRYPYRQLKAGRQGESNS